MRLRAQCLPFPDGHRAAPRVVPYVASAAHPGHAAWLAQPVTGSSSFGP